MEWIQQPIHRDYSTLTVSIPKKSDGKVELTFVDAIPQHERARNKATYNYQTSQIEKLDLYESKALNEKATLILKACTNN